MVENKIDLLKKYRAAIIFGEIGALLHDLGKLDGRFLVSKFKNSSTSFNHLEMLDHDKELIKSLGLYHLFTGGIATILNLSGDIVREWGLGPISLDSLIRKHEKYNPKKNEKLIGFVQIADKKDSADDRLMPLAKQEEETYTSSPFGIESKININELEGLRRKFYDTISKLPHNEIKDNDKDKKMREFREKIIEAWKNVAIKTIAETRRAANDVTLWDHSYAVASLMKVLMVQDIIEDFNLQIWEKNRLKPHYRFKLRVLGIGWNSSRILKEAQTLSGMAGRDLLIKAIREGIRNLLEFEIPVGNIIYEDHNFICFLVPENLDLIFEEIKEILMDKIVKLSNGSIIPRIELSDPNPYPSRIVVQVLNKLQSKIKTPLLLEGSLGRISWIKEWRGVKSREICVECGKRPRMEDRDICEWCHSLRVEGAKAGKKQNGVYKETVWMDEIADENGNVALIYGFIPLEKWLDGSFLKTMLIKTIDDVIELNRKVGKNKVKLWQKPEYKPIREEIKNKGYYKVMEMLDEFLQQINKEGYRKAKQELIRPFLADELPVEIKPMLEDIYLSLRSRIGSTEPRDWVTELFAKPSSPSRLTRIWRETLEFTNELVREAQNIVEKSIGGYCLRMKIEPEFVDEKTREFLERNKYQPYEVVELKFDIPLPKIDMYWDGEYFYTTLRIENYVTLPRNGTEESLKDKQEKIKTTAEKLRNSTFKIKIDKEKIVQIKVKNVDFEEYLPFRNIMVSPSHFKILVPANLALKITHRFLKKYDNKFSKVRGRLSFNVGIAFFKRKFPLFAVMDGVERSAESLSSYLSKEGWKKFKVENLNDAEMSVAEIDNEAKEELSEFGAWISSYKWKIEQKLGSGENDLYHPNFIVTEASGNEESYFKITLDGGEVAILNVKDLKEKTIRIMPNLFDFQFFDSTVRRFDLVLPRKHELLGEGIPRPYLLEDVKKMLELWNILEKNFTKTQIKNLEHVCASKIKEWELRNGYPVKDHDFKEFVVSSVENICKGLSTEEKRQIKEKLISSILSGMFFDIVELFIKLETEAGGEENG